MRFQEKSGPETKDPREVKLFGPCIEGRIILLNLSPLVVILGSCKHHANKSTARLPNMKRRNGPTEPPTDGQMDGQVGGRTDGRTDRDAL